MLKNLFFALLSLLIAAAPSRANEQFQLGLPIACAPGKDCWIVHYVDTDPGPGAKDFTCGGLTNDGHQGVDFAIQDLVAMQQGVNVLAAAAGTVKAVRDGVVDREMTEEDRARIQGKECGNGVRIDHGNGWTTQYCHLRQHSIRVRPGDSVKPGQQLGFVGLSGQTQFPHLHLTVRYYDKLVDPFTAVENPSTCKNDNKKSLWKDEIKPLLIYRPVAIYNEGFADQKVNADEVRAGKYRDVLLLKDSPTMIFWADIFGVYPQDKITIRIRDPNGNILVQQNKEMDKSFIRYFQFVGKKKDESSWPAGLYRGELTLTRKTDRGIEEFSANKSITIR